MKRVLDIGFYFGIVMNYLLDFERVILFISFMICKMRRVDLIFFEVFCGYLFNDFFSNNFKVKVIISILLFSYFLRRYLLLLYYLLKFLF